MSVHYKAPSRTAGQQAPTPVLLTCDGPVPQSRLTVLFRPFLVLPHLIVLGVLGIAAGLVAIIGWFGALATGRLPGFAAGFGTGYLRWQARVSGYATLLTGEYPPFSPADADYPIRVEAAPGPLSRLAVLFRLFLLIPCWIVQALAGAGVFVVLVAAWVIALVKGELPTALHEALSAVLRFQARVLGFALMLTSAYPSGLFGDLAQSAPGHRPAPGQLALSGGARKLVGAFVVLGLCAAAGAGGTAIGLSSHDHAASNARAERQYQADMAPVVSAINTYSAQVSKCKGTLACVQKLDRGVAATLTTAAARVRAIPMPFSEASTGATSLAGTMSATASIFARLGAAANAAQFDKIASGLQQSANQLNEEYLALGGMLAG
jgi:hypothetical protein